jgi:hypothetical protein
MLKSTSGIIQAGSTLLLAEQTMRFRRGFSSEKSGILPDGSHAATGIKCTRLESASASTAQPIHSNSVAAAIVACQIIKP